MTSWGQSFPLGSQECFGTKWMWWLHHILNVLNAPELYIWKWLILWLMTFTSIKIRFLGPPRGEWIGGDKNGKGRATGSCGSGPGEKWQQLGGGTMGLWCWNCLGNTHHPGDWTGLRILGQREEHGALEDRLRRSFYSFQLKSQQRLSSSGGGQEARGKGTAGGGRGEGCSEEYDFKYPSRKTEAHLTVIWGEGKGKEGLCLLARGQLSVL